MANVPKNKLSIVVRGRATGIWKVSCDYPSKYSSSATTEKQKILAEIPVNVFSEDWKVFSGNILLPKEAFPLYLTFEGDGILDLLEIRF